MASRDHSPWAAWPDNVALTRLWIPYARPHPLETLKTANARHPLDGRRVWMIGDGEADVAVGKAAEMGVLIRNGDALQQAGKLTTIVFDKTGTLTRGAPEIAAITVNPQREEYDHARALRLATALEDVSAHPIARAFQAMDIELADPPPRPRLDGAVVIRPGRGLHARMDGSAWRIGTAQFVAVPVPDNDDAIWLADARSWVARFELRDALRPEAKAIVESLGADGIEVRILSGDSQTAVAAAADRLGIDHFLARQTPAMKLDALVALRESGRITLMVGDGVNDAPVLAAADVSMTVKGGAELANSTADLILIGESLGLVATARAIARRARQLIRQNLAWAVLYNASVMPLAVSGMLKPWMAALGMSLSSLLVVANASRLVREGRRSPDAGQALEQEGDTP